MQIDRMTLKPEQSPLASNGAYCALECKDCKGLCLAVYMMLTPDEQDALYRLMVEPEPQPVGHC
ncbi:hypothetical protein [Thalassococcus sp. S3]|uniref:hypothetical protein n=1 Tax=Thalassococcus sp. S3 TaxID=2017482 RepID=UPI0010242B82|nr:hypothetical protein [Thalassococcus sp. S3]QBF33865.1 hypothetical protein CFI11_22005 [Thalassococcus sp. S3]